MSDETKTYQLIVRRRPAANAELNTLLQVLYNDFGLDTYTARQRLIGPGLALFGKGLLERTGRISALLQQYGFACWLIEPQKPAFDPDLLRSLEIHSDHIVFTCQQGLVRLERGMSVVGVLADLSGGLADKHIKRLLAQNTYRGSDALAVIGRDEIMRITLQGQPIFDFYLLDQEGKVQQAVQAMPGRFNVDGLGSRATMSAARNLQALVKLVEEYAGPFRLYCDFGLSQLPRCDIKKASDSPSATMENLDSLTRYGWLVTQLQGEGRPAADQYPADADPLTAIAAAVTVGQATLGGLSGLDSISSPGALLEELQGVPEASSEKVTEQPPVETRAERRDLPAPPERPLARPSWGKSFIVVFVAAAGFAIAAGSGGHELFRLVSRYGMVAGIIPAIVAVPLLWGGFHYLRLKRRIENTPTSKVRSVAMGLVEVHGRTQRLYALVAPMTQSACVWYRLRKYRKYKNNNWKLVKEVNSSHVPFQVDDGTGRVIVDPAGSTVKARVQQAGFPGQSPLTFTAFGSGYDEEEKWIEEVIYEGTSIYVLGYAQPLREERMSLRERAMIKLRQLKVDPQAMHRYDTDSDGVIDEAEWQVARNDAELEAMHDHLAEGNARKRQEEHVVIGRDPHHGLPFIITETVSEADLVRKYGQISLALLIAGLGSTGLALYKFLQYIGV
ncbi:MAG: GIDE domain-containing protein [Desulfuromonadales bacterium]|nr:GIDE domain-containing protein [Desulfuromonadales bacterium]